MLAFRLPSPILGLRLLVVWLGITSAAPFIFYVFPWHPHRMLAALVSGVIFLEIISVKKCIITKYQLVLFFSSVLTNWLLFFLHYDDFYIASIIRILNIFIFFIYIKNFIGVSVFVKSIVIFCQVLIFFNAIIFVLGLLGRLTVPEIFVVDDRDYYNFILSVALTTVVFNFGEVTFIRAGGYFDEPGAFALFITYALLFNKLSIDDKRSERIMIFGGLLTFSFAYFISLFLYLIFLKNSPHSVIILVKRIFKALLFVVVFSAVFLLLSPHSDFASFGRDVLISRFIDRPENHVDPRIVEFEIATEHMLDSPIFGTGFSNFRDTHEEGIGSTPLGPIVFHGFLGAFFLFLPIFYLIFSCHKLLFDKRMRYIFFGVIIIIGLNIMQRPFIDMVMIYVFILTTIELIKNHNNKLKKS